MRQLRRLGDRNLLDAQVGVEHLITGALLVGLVPENGPIRRVELDIFAGVVPGVWRQGIENTEGSTQLHGNIGC